MIAFLAILLVLCLAAGAYVWYSGQNTSPTDSLVPDDTSLSPAVSQPPVNVDPNAPVSVSISGLFLEVAPGSTQNISLKTKPGALCEADVFRDSNPDQPFISYSNEANDRGFFTWKLVMPDTALPGEWYFEATCSLDEKSGYVKQNFEVIQNASS